MAVILIAVPHNRWNDVQMAAVLFGLMVSPEERDREGDVTLVEMTGDVAKLQQAFNRLPGTRLIAMFEKKPNGEATVFDG